MRIRAGLRAALHSFVLMFLSGVGTAALFTAVAVAVCLIPLGVGVYLTPAALAAERRGANLRRRLAGEWYGVQIPQPYPPQPEFRSGIIGQFQRCQWLLTDPVTWRDKLWMLVDMSLGCFLAAIPAMLLAEGLFGTVLAAGVWRPIFRSDGGEWYNFIHVTSQTRANEAAVWGVVLIVLGLGLGPAIMRAHARLTRRFLAPTRERELQLRVAHLAQTRTETLDVQAAELRRIERDLHDGAQARLVAMGMSLGAADRLIEQDPARARKLLEEARDSSVKALAELRDLVRGIHPPVLAERGLGDAVRAQALASPLPTEVTVDIPGRLPAPVESAAYFAVCELLANAAKHARAQRMAVALRHADGVLHIRVSDDGRGGADPSRGTGLAGVARRLAAFDGRFTLDSPPGGPTTVIMELPCALSSPKTSSSSGTA
jgi:signal transduction histidine kinase